MTTITLQNITSGYNVSKLNDNFAKLEEVINEELLHTEGGNNVMQQDIDMNGYKLLNVGGPLGGTPVFIADYYMDNLSPEFSGSTVIITEEVSSPLPLQYHEEYPSNTEIRLINASGYTIYLGGVTTPSGFRPEILPGRGPVSLLRVGDGPSWWAFGDLVQA